MITVSMVSEVIQVKPDEEPAEKLQMARAYFQAIKMSFQPPINFDESISIDGVRMKIVQVHVPVLQKAPS